HSAMREKLKTMIAASDLVVVARSNLITSTGGSLNVEIEVEDVLKGARDCKTIRIAFSTMGATSPPEPEPGERYLFFLQARRNEELPAYDLIAGELDAIVSVNDH